MIGRPRLLSALALSAAVGVAFWLSWRAGAGRLFGEDAAEAAREQAAINVLREVREARQQRPEIDAAIAAFADRTLGGTLAAVDSALRTRLNRLGESERLRELAVGTGASVARQSPAKARYSRSADQKALRDEVDLVELQAWISGEGAPDQILRLVQRIEAEPWLKRIESIRLDAQGTGQARGERLKATVRLTTCFLPGREPQTSLTSSWKPEDAERLASLLEQTRFALPPPPPPPTTPVEVAAAPPAAAPAPPAFPYADWRLTGVARGLNGVEAWLHNQRSGELRVLAKGESLHEMTLREASGDRAEFSLGEQVVAVAVGSSLNDRTVVGQ